MTPLSRRYRSALTSLIVLLFGVAPSGATVTPGLNLRTMEFGGYTRDYRIHVPAIYDGSSPVPLVLDIHGYTSNASQQEGGSKMREVSEREGFIVVYPNGLNTGSGTAWNAGICCSNKSIDDVGFLRAVVAAVQAETTIDARRIYATGLSNGGGMTHRLACEAADLFAAAAPMAFPVPFIPLSECQPSRAIPVYTFMGLTDVLVRYDGHPSALETFAYWRDMNGCGAGAPDERVDSGKSYCETYTSCTNDVQVGLCSITANSFGGLPFDGHVLYLNPDFVLAEVAWEFLSQFQLPESSAPVHAVLTGPVTLKLPGKRRIKKTLSWAVTLGDGTWAATDASGTVYTGNAERRRRGRQRTLTLTGDSQATLLEALAAEASAMAGADVTLTLAGARLGARVGRGGGRVELAGKLDLAGNGAAGVTKARWAFRLRGGAGG